MAIAFKDRVKTECTTIGTGDIVFGSTRHGFQDWSKVTNGETVYYCLLNVDEWEVGYGIKSTGGIQRNVLDSTTGSKISLTGSADVFLTYPADGVIAKDTNGNLILDGTITATSYFGDASTLDNLPTLESLGIENHNQIIVNTDGVISGDGGGLTNININLADNGLNNHDKITVDELGNLNANSISIDSSLGYPNNWAVTAQPTEFLVTQNGATKGKIGSDGKMTATGFVGDGSELTGIESLPNQTGQDGKYLQTDGINATWQEVAGGEGTVADGCIYLNNQVITSDYVFPLGKNGMSAGPISVEGSVEVGDGTWTIVGEGGGATLESLGIPNHDKVTVDVDGHVTVNASPNSWNMNFVGRSGDNRSSLHFSDNANTTQYVDIMTDASGLSFSTSATERMKIDADGKASFHNGLAIKTLTGADTLKLEQSNAAHGWLVKANELNGYLEFFRYGRDDGLKYSWGHDRCDISVPLYVQGNPKSIDVAIADVETRLADRDKLIEKLSARLDKLEAKMKKVK